MTQEKDPRAQNPRRPVNLDELRRFWDTMSYYFPDLRVNLYLFNYKVIGKESPLIQDNVRENVPVAQAYEAVLGLLDDYHKGEDIFWIPAYSLTETDMLWVDDFKFDNELGLEPLFYIQTSPGKYQAFFKLTEPIPVREADELQKALARLVGDKTVGSFRYRRRMAGLANGKYEDDPLVTLTVPETPSLISIRRTIGYYIVPVNPAEYKPITHGKRDEFAQKEMTEQ
jgi:hypothetical protein